jgi:hypothetical protein
VLARALGRSSNRLQVAAHGCRLVVVKRTPALILRGFRTGLTEQRSPVPEEATEAASIG